MIYAKAMNSEVLTDSFQFYFLDVKKRKNSNKSHSDNSSISSVAIIRIIDKLKMERNRDSTRKNYLAVWQVFSKFT